MRILDLFSGTGSVHKVAKEMGHEIISLDISNKFSTPTIQVDLMQWDYAKYAPGHFDFIWAGVPCTAYSSLQRINKTPDQRQKGIAEANKIVLLTIEIIEYFKPTAWVIENPEGGCLKEQEFMQSLPYYVVSYCKYSFPYRKNTRLWTNIKNFNAKRCRFDCDALTQDGRHQNAIGNSKRNLGANQRRTYNLWEKFAYPPELVRELLLQSQHDTADNLI